jgi:hypothetical protein
LFNALRDTGVKCKIIAIDPLDSYYGEVDDPITFMPITKQTVIRNLKRADFPLENFILINTPSEFSETVDFMQSVLIGGIYIDGDHSYDGIKRDWNNYAKLVIPGGYVLIDNYHDNYGGIDQFVDKELLPDSDNWVVAGTLNRSIVFFRK